MHVHLAHISPALRRVLTELSRRTPFCPRRRTRKSPVRSSSSHARQAPSPRLFARSRPLSSSPHSSITRSRRPARRLSSSSCSLSRLSLARLAAPDPAMPRPPLAPSPSEPLRQLVDRTSSAASVIRPSASDAPPRSPAPPAAVKPTSEPRPSLSTSGAASSPALATTSGSPSSSSLGDRLGNGERSTATRSSSTTSSSTPETSSDGFPTLGDVDEALPQAVPAESCAAGPRATSTPPRSAEAASAPAAPLPVALGGGCTAHDSAHGGALSSHAWSPPATASALGMTMGGIPLALPLSSGTFNPSSRRTGVCKFFNAQKVRTLSTVLVLEEPRAGR